MLNEVQNQRLKSPKSLAFGFEDDLLSPRISLSTIKDNFDHGKDYLTPLEQAQNGKQQAGLYSRQMNASYNAIADMKPQQSFFPD